MISFTQNFPVPLLLKNVSVTELRFFLLYEYAQCLASWFSCEENYWIFQISRQDLANYSWQGSQDFARFFKIAERNSKSSWSSWQQNQEYPRSWQEKQECLAS